MEIDFCVLSLLDELSVALETAAYVEEAMYFVGRW